MPDEFCPCCGRHGRPNDRFCRGCGAALTDEASAAGPIEEAESLVARGLLSDAIAAVLRAIGAHETPELRVALATLYLRRGGIDEAARELHRAIALDPSCALAHAYLGALLVRSGRIAEAEAALDRARELAPNDLLVSMKRAEYLIVLGVLEGARDELRHGLEDGGGTPEMRLAAARLLSAVERRLSHSVMRHPVALPSFGAIGRLIRRRRVDTEMKPLAMEA